MRYLLRILYFSGLLAATSTGAGGGAEGTALDEYKVTGRFIAYLLVALLAAPAAWDLFRCKKIPTPGVIVSTYFFMYLFIATKLATAYFDVAALQHIIAAILYFGVFGLYLRKANSRFDLQFALTAIGGANIILVGINLPLTLTLDAYNIQGRLSGFAFNPNVLGHSLALTSACLALTLRRFLGGKFLFLAITAILLGNLILVYLTLSRGAFVILMVAAAFNFYITSAWFRRLSPVLLPVVLSILAITITDSDYYRVLFEDREQSREEVFKNQWDEFVRNPLTGADWRAERIVYGENMFLGAISQLGIIGLIFVCLIIFPRFFLFFKMGWLNRRRSNAEEVGEYRTAAVFIGLTILSGLLESLLLGVIGPIIIAFLMIDAGSGVRSSKRHKSQRSFDRSSELGPRVEKSLRTS